MMREGSISKTKMTLTTLALVLVGLMMTGLMMQQLVYGTNESSYKTGVWFGYNNYKCISNDDPCDGPFPSQISNECSVNAGVSNSTACYDGYYEGFTTWCTQYHSDCVAEFKAGNTPTPGLG